MKSSIMKVLDDADEPAIQRLVDLGIRRVVSEIIVFLDQVEESTVKEISVGTHRQNTLVSRALRHMRRKRWIVETRYINSYGTGAPFYRESLALSIPELEREVIDQMHYGYYYHHSKQ